MGKLCVGKLYVGKWCKLCVWVSCVWVSYVWVSCVWVSCVWVSWWRGRREEEEKADGSAQPKTRTQHNDAGKKVY